MKKLLLLLTLFLFTQFGFSQIISDSSILRNVEVYFSPFQTRLGGFEYDKTITNKENWFDVQTDANRLIVNDIEVGLNYLFKIKKLNFGAGISYYTDDFKFFIITELHNKIYRINRKGLSLNLFYRQRIFSGTTLDLGLNTRFNVISWRVNFNDYNQSSQVSSTRNVLVFEDWTFGGSFIQFIPSIQFNSVIYKSFYVKYGILAKFWGNEFYSARATEKYGNKDTLLDFSMNESSFKATFSIGYSF